MRHKPRTQFIHQPPNCLFVIDHLAHQRKLYPIAIAQISAFKTNFNTTVAQLLTNIGIETRRG
jgi:hypothetical protein